MGQGSSLYKVVIKLINDSWQNDMKNHYMFERPGPTYFVTQRHAHALLTAIDTDEGLKLQTSVFESLTANLPLVDNLLQGQCTL